VSVDPSQMDGANYDMPATTNDDPGAAWDQQLTLDLKAQVSTYLDPYLDENLIPRSKEFDMLHWWRGNSSKYLVLSRIARDVLAILASFVASEFAFNVEKRIISEFCSSLTPETVEGLICLQDWYRAAGIIDFRHMSQCAGSKFSFPSIHEVACDDMHM
jgi:hypothetical protein